VVEATVHALLIAKEALDGADAVAVCMCVYGVGVMVEAMVVVVVVSAREIVGGRCARHTRRVKH